MVITFNKNSDLTEIKGLFAQHKGKKKSEKNIDKPFDAKRFCGALKSEEDGLLIQKRLRDEWIGFD